MPSDIDAVVRELREAEALADIPNPAEEDAYRFAELCREHMPAILDALECVTRERDVVIKVVRKVTNASSEAATLVI